MHMICLCTLSRCVGGYESRLIWDTCIIVRLGFIQTCSLVGTLGENLRCSEAWSSRSGSYLLLSLFNKSNTKQDESEASESEKLMIIEVDVLSRKVFTWTCRCCIRGQSDSSYRWGSAVRPCEASDCCSERGQEGGPCSRQTTFDWLGPQFCWVLPTKWR